MPRTAAVVFDVDFTLIAPGPRFQASGYHACCARHGVAVDPARFDAAVDGAAALLDVPDHAHQHKYDERVFLDYTRRIIELMGGRGPAVDRAARETFDDWHDVAHFTLYEDAADTLRALHARGIRIGLLSNTNRSLESFAAHFGLAGLVTAALKSPDHGRMKPHPSIFRAALDLLQVPADAAVMVGDSLTHDVRGAQAAGMRAIWLCRHTPAMTPEDVESIRSLRDLPALI